MIEGWVLIDLLIFSNIIGGFDSLFLIYKSFDCFGIVWLCLWIFDLLIGVELYRIFGKVYLSGYWG